MFRMGLLGVGCALLAFARPCAAQGVTLNALGVTHAENVGRANRLNSTLNHRDCAVGDTLAFPVTLTDYQGLALEVWAGSACDEIEQRVLSNDICWKLGSFQPTSASPPPIAIRVSALLSGRTLAGIPPNGPQSLPNPPVNPDACHDAFGSSVGAETLSVYFMLVDASETVQGAFATWTATYKLNAPAPPDHVSLESGPQQLLAKFSYNDDSPGDVTINGYQLYCEPNTTVPADQDADAAAPTCTPSSRLVAGADVSNLQDLLCGTAGRADTSAKLEGLSNGVPYNVAVATIDSYDNVGTLSPVACAAPAAAVSEQTAKACSFAPGRPSFPVLPMLGIGLCLVRRRRRR